MPAVTDASVPWYRTITREQWRALAAAKIGWMLDAMDFMLYAVALNQLRLYFGFDDATAGLLTTAALVMSGVGGLTFGYIGDRKPPAIALSAYARAEDQARALASGFDAHVPKPVDAFLLVRTIRDLLSTAA